MNAYDKLRNVLTQAESGKALQALESLKSSLAEIEPNSKALECLEEALIPMREKAKQDEGLRALVRKDVAERCAELLRTLSSTVVMSTKMNDNYWKLNYHWKEFPISSFNISLIRIYEGNIAQWRPRLLVECGDWVCGKNFNYLVVEKDSALGAFFAKIIQGSEGAHEQQS